MCRSNAIDLNDLKLNGVVLDKKTLKAIFDSNTNLPHNKASLKNVWQAAQVLNINDDIYVPIAEYAANFSLTSDPESIENIESRYREKTSINLSKCLTGTLPSGLIKTLRNPTITTIDVSKNNLSTIDLNKLHTAFPNANIVACDNNINEVSIHRRFFNILASFQNKTIDLRNNPLTTTTIANVNKALQPGLWEKYRPELNQLTDRYMALAIGQEIKDIANGLWQNPGKACTIPFASFLSWYIIDNTCNFIKERELDLRKR